MLQCNETVTLVQHEPRPDGDRYTCTAIVGASWFAKTAIKLENGGVAAASIVKVRIPEDNMPQGVTPRNGDFLVRGVVASVEQPGRDLQKHEHITIQAVGDNRRGQLSHWAVTGA